MYNPFLKWCGIIKLNIQPPCDPFLLLGIHLKEIKNYISTKKTYVRVWYIQNTAYLSGINKKEKTTHKCNNIGEFF